MSLPNIFYAALALLYLYIALIIWSVVQPRHRLWPVGENRWKLIPVWGVFYAVVALALAVIVLDWNRWLIPNPLRFGVGIPLIILGLALLNWGIATLGLKNTHGLRDRFVLAGPYRFTRNPQYLGDIIMLTGITLVVNSLYLLVINALIILSFLLLPLPEEIWLEEVYGETYRRYKTQTPRFL
jgi:protein-S-isoprenylcysteine O-methyltransferase Ste14